MNIMINSNKYVIYYLEENTNTNIDNRYYKYCKYKENDKSTIININKEINRQIKNYKNNKDINSNYQELVSLFHNKSYTINIYGGYDEDKVEIEYNKLIKLPQYKLKSKPKIKKELYDNTWTDAMINDDYKYRLERYELFNKEKIDNRIDLKNRLINSHSIDKFIEGDLNNIKIYFNNFLDNNKSLNKKKENIKNNPNEKIKCSCGMYYTRTNKSHHFKKHHNNKCLIIDI